MVRLRVQVFEDLSQWKGTLKRMPHWGENVVKRKENPRRPIASTTEEAPSAPPKRMRNEWERQSKAQNDSRRDTKGKGPARQHSPPSKRTKAMVEDSMSSSDVAEEGYSSDGKDRQSISSW